MFELWVSDYRSYESLLGYLGFAITANTKTFFVNQYKKTIAQAGQDCDKLDVIFETVPPFVTQALDDASLWEYLNHLLSCWMVAEVGTNEDKAALTLLNSIKNQQWLYDQLLSKEEVAVKLYNQLEGDWLLGYLELCRQLTNQYSRQPAPANQFIYLGSAGSAYRDNPALYQKPYLLTDASGYRAAEKQLFFECIIGRPNVLPINWGSVERHTDISRFHCGLFSPVRVYFGEADNVEQLPALYAYYLGGRSNRGELLAAVNKGVTVFGVASGVRILFTKGAGYLAKSIAVTELVKVTLDAALAKESVQASLNRTEGGRWLVKNWPILSIATDLATVGTDILVSLSRNKAVIRQALAENGERQAVERFDELVGEAETVAQARVSRQTQPVDEVAVERADGSRNALGSGKTVPEALSNAGKITNVFFKDVDEFAATFDKAGNVSQNIRDQAFDLYKQGNWSELEILFRTNNINYGWPPANGGYNIVDNVKIKAGEKFDRYGGALKNYDGQGVPNLGGNFTSPMPNGRSFSFGQRALNQPENAYDFYYEIEVIRDLPFMAQTGDVIPWFDQVGGGQQAMWKIPVDTTTGYPKTWKGVIQKYAALPNRRSPIRQPSGSSPVGRYP